MKSGDLSTLPVEFAYATGKLLSVSKGSGI